MLYVGDWKGFFYGIDSAGGAVMWQNFVGMAPAPANPICQPSLGVTGQATVTDSTVYVNGGDSAVYAFDRITGRQLWRVQVADPATGSYLWGGLTLSNHSLYTGVASLGDCPIVRGVLVRIDLDDPQHPLFQYVSPTDEAAGGIWSTPAVDEATNTVYVTTGTGKQDPSRGLYGGTLLAMDATTLDIKGFFFLPTNDLDHDIEWGSSPTLLETSDGTRMVVATAKDGNLWAVRRDDFQLLWMTNLCIGGDTPQAGYGSLSTPAFDGTYLYVGAGAVDPDDWDHRGSVYAINPLDGSVVWKQILTGPVIAPVTVANGVVFAASTAGLVTFDRTTGDLLWTDPARAMMYSQPIIADGVLYTSYVKGRITAWQSPESSTIGSPVK
jgi:polyvinyl alcohol dehydrogenase (cytochrome)